MKIEKRFHFRFGPGTVTFPMKVEAWAMKRSDALGRFVLAFVVPWLKELFVKLKTRETMASVDAQAEALVDSWESEEPSVKEPTYTAVEDPESPLGVSELRASHDFMDGSQTDT